VAIGLPAGRFQSGGTCRIHAAGLGGGPRKVNCEQWPKSRRHLLVTRWESGEQPVVLLTSAFDSCMRVYGILKILRSAHVSNASRRESRYLMQAK